MGYDMTSDGFDNRINELYQELRILILQNAKGEDYDDQAVVKFYQISKEIIQLKQDLNSLKQGTALLTLGLGNSMFIASDS